MKKIFLLCLILSFTLFIFGCGGKTTSTNLLGGIVGTAQLQDQSDHSGITVEISGASKSTTTGSDGRYSFSNINAGTVILIFTKSEYASQSKSVIVSAKVTTNVATVTLSSNYGSVAGTAKLEGQTDHSGISVSISVEGYSSSASTNSSGSYSFTNLTPGTVTLNFSKSGFISVATTNTITAGATTNVSVTLNISDGDITGTVDLEGQTDDSGATVAIDGTSLEATTGTNGSFTISDVPTGTYSLTISKSGFVTGNTSNVVVREGEVTDIGTITITIVRISVSGVIKFDGPGSPGVEGITVTLNSDSQVATTDANGEYSFTNVEIGTHTITPTKNGWAFDPTSYTVSSNASDKDFEASIEGWTNISNSNITHDLYDYSYYDGGEGGDTYHVLVGPGGKAYISTDLQDLDQHPFTTSAIVSAGDIVRCRASYGPVYDLRIFSKDTLFVWDQNDMPGPAQTPGGIHDFSNFTEEAEDFAMLFNDTDAIMIAAGGGLFYNVEIRTTPDAFDSTNRAPTGMKVRSMIGEYGGNQYNFLIGGDDGKLYEWSGTVLPDSSSDWEEITSGTTEKITGISMGQGVVFITENGSLGYSANGSFEFEIEFTGLPYTLNGVFIPGDSYSGTIIVGSNGLMLRKD